jgi:hypothetical protein
MVTIVDIATNCPERTLLLAASEMEFGNATLPVGACFVPRVIRKDEGTLRFFFASENPEERQSQTWYRDFDLTSQEFDANIYQVELETDFGVFPMQPEVFNRHVAAKGFQRPTMTYGLYQIDGFKEFDGKLYTILNNFPFGPSGLAVMNDSLDRFIVLGSFFEPQDASLNESAFNKLPGGRWIAISRQGSRDYNYMFAESADGVTWTENEYRDCVRNGADSKPNFDRFDGVYYLGWQDAERVDGIYRSIFNIDVSLDGVSWERKYRFETTLTFQYATFKQHDGHVYVSVTQGKPEGGGKERILFGVLE